MKLQQGAQNSDRFWFIHILSYKVNPIRNQMETVLDSWLVNVCMNECELIEGGHTFGLLAVEVTLVALAESIAVGYFRANYYLKKQKCKLWLDW